MQRLIDPVSARDFCSAEVTFTLGERTAWHTHPAGRNLIVTAGTGWVHEWGSAKTQMNAGDGIWTAPHVKHWDGPFNHAAMTHIAIQSTPDRSPAD